MTRAPLAIALLVLLPGLAHAHGEPRGPGYREHVEDDVLFSMDLSTRIALAHTPTRLLLGVRSYALDGEHVPGAPLEARLVPPGEDAQPLALTLEPTQQEGHHVAAVEFGAAGAWWVELRSGETVARLPLRVHPGAPYLFDWSRDSDLWFHPHRENRLAFVVTHPLTGDAIDPPPDMALHLSRWDDERQTRLWEDVLPLPPSGAPGEVARLQRFDEPGAYEVRLSAPSLGLGPEDRPGWPILVTVVDDVDWPQPGEVRLETPAPGAPLALLAAAAALAARAGRRPR